MENALLESFKLGRVSGTVHTCVGQELCAAALHPHLRPGHDSFFATHRGHGHYLAYGGPEDALIAELMGREGALCSGQGGTQNLHFQRFFSSGIQGGAAGIGVGYAWARRHQGEDAITVVQLGDGTLGEGSVYEAFTLAATWSAPVLFLIEWNGWAQSTDTSNTSPGDIVRRAEGFGIAAIRTTDLDPAALHDAFARAVTQVRTSGEPMVMTVDTRRLLAHSKGDDDRPSALVAELWAADPISKAVAADAVLAETQKRHTDETLQLAELVFARPALVPLNRQLSSPATSFEPTGFHQKK